MKLSFYLWMVSVCITSVAAGQTPPAIFYDDGKVLITSLGIKASAVGASSITKEQWEEIFAVYTHEAYLKKLDQSVSGEVRWKGDTMTFTPDFPFAAGESYDVDIDYEALSEMFNLKRNSCFGEKVHLSFEVAKDEFPVTAITAVCPSSSTLPENMLRMYIYFSAPMMAGEAYDHIKLYNKDGSLVEKAFLIVDQELWNSARNRFTLLFDPGRIKRDLKSNLDLGTPLKEGLEYRLVIDSTWRDVHGNFLKSSISKTFAVTHAERRRLSTKDWSVIPPSEGSTDDLVIRFDRPMDQALILKYFQINSASGATEGRLQMQNDSLLTFKPNYPWQSGRYFITLSALLEDVAGNNFNNAFDLDLSVQGRVNSTEPVKLEFFVKSSSP